VACVQYLGHGRGLRSNFGVHFHERTERTTGIGTDRGPVPLQSGFLSHEGSVIGRKTRPDASE
jgi:hypothetical protein